MARLFKVLDDTQPTGAGRGDSFVVRAGKSLDLQGLNIDSIRLTHVADTSYQIVVW